MTAPKEVRVFNVNLLDLFEYDEMPNNIKVIRLTDHDSQVQALKADFDSQSLTICQQEQDLKQAREEIAKLQSALDVAVEGLEKAELNLRYKSHKHWQMVKQLDGSIQNELVESQDGKIHKEIEATLDKIKQIRE